MPRKTHRVVPHGRKWAVIVDGGEKAIKLFPTKQPAVGYARPLSKRQKSELVIHRKDGQIQNADSHGNDPCPPKDKK